MERGQQFNKRLAAELASGQLPMFLTPNEIRQHVTLGDAYSEFDNSSDAKEYDRRSIGAPKTKLQADTEDRLLAQKASDNKIEGLDKSVASEGVKTPLTILSNRSQSPMLWNGHHRLAAALDSRPDQLIPLEHI